MSEIKIDTLSGRLKMLLLAFFGLRRLPTCTLSLSLTHSLTLSHTHTHSHYLSLCPSLKHTLLTLADFVCLSVVLSLKHVLALIQPISQTLTLPQTYTNKHKQTQTNTLLVRLSNMRTFSLSLTLSLSLSLSISLSLSLRECDKSSLGLALSQ